MKTPFRLVLFVVLVAVWVVGCASPPVQEVADLPAASATAVAPTAAPTDTATAVPTQTATPLPSPTATDVPTETPTATPLPGVQVLVIDASRGTAVAGATVTLQGADGSSISAAAGDNGVAIFADVAAGDYTVIVAADDFVETSRPLTVVAGMMETAVILPPIATPTPIPTATFTPAPTVAAVNNAPIVSAAPPSGANLLNNSGFEAGNTGWDYGVIPFAASENPNLVYSGSFSANQGGLVQRVPATIGQAYRAGVWVRLWSSTGFERGVSVNPGDFYARVCIHNTGEVYPDKAGAFCSGPVRPIDTWQFIAVDAVAQAETITIILQAYFGGPNQPVNNQAYWDDAVMGLSPVAPTATPAPLGAPVPPAPVAFNGSALRDNMTTLFSRMEHLGGLLDRLAGGSRETCSEYMGYYRDIVQSPRYDGVPGDWQGIYNDYVFAVENVRARNEGVFGICLNGGGSVSQQAYGNARQSVAESTDRLRPAIDAANGLLGP